MKSLVGSLLAALVGLAMLGFGIAGVAGAFEEDEDSGSESAACTSTDPRIAELETFDIDAGLIIINCVSGEYQASFAGTGVKPSSKPRTFALWLYNSRDDAELVAGLTQTPGDTTPVLSGPLPDDTERFKKWALSVEPPTDGDPERPTKIIESVKL